FPAYATSMGRVLLAGLSPEELDCHLQDVEMEKLTPKTITSADTLRTMLKRVNTQGYALVDQELEVGLRSIAVPVHVRDRVVAAINVSMHASRGSSDGARRELLPPLRETAAAIEADLAASPAATALASSHLR
ncbi:MAG TPA: IclR family transcriptional regulator C-terminal domain-containing protein, partial [Mycobacteriales bacterium]